MKNFLKIFGGIIALITGILLLVLGFGWLLLQAIMYNQWLLIPILIISFAFYGAVLLLPMIDSD